jgi:hypothetical protein
MKLRCHVIMLCRELLISFNKRAGKKPKRIIFYRYVLDLTI